MEIKKKSIVTGALILTAASIITRILGFIYRVYMSKTVGAEGMGLYQLIMPLYGLAWSISCSGFTTTVSKIVAQEKAKKNYGNMGRALKQSLVITCSIATVLSIAMYLFSSFLAKDVLNSQQVDLSLKILAFSLPFMAAGSSIRGYFFGMQESSVPAISQVLEQVVRMVTIYLLAGTFIPMGIEYACAVAVVGIFFGEVISFLYVFYSYKMFKRKNRLTTRPTLSSQEMLSMLLTMALPLTFNRIAGSLLATVENLLIPQKLQAYGYSAKEALSLFGQINGMALPLIFFPSAILYALSTTLVPAVSEAIAVRNKKRITYTVNKALLFTCVIGIGASAIFIAFPKELGMLIYDQDISEMLFLLGLMCPLWYISITFSGILNGLGEQVFMFKNGIISSVISIGFIYFLVPIYGLNAFILGWFISLAVTVVSCIYRIKKRAEIDIPIIKWFIKPILSALASLLTVKYIANNLVFSLFGELLGLIVCITLLMGMYLFFIMILDVISIEDVTSLFKGLPIRKQQQAKVKDKEIM